MESKRAVEKVLNERKVVKMNSHNKDDIKYYKLKYPDFSQVIKGRSITLKEPK